MNKSEKRSYDALRLARSDGAYPTILLDRLGEKAPEALTAIGPIEYLANRKTALFCSALKNRGEWTANPRYIAIEWWPPWLMQFILPISSQAEIRIAFWHSLENGR